MKQKVTRREIFLIVEWILAAFSILLCIKRGFSGMPLSWVFNVAADIVCMFINIFFIMGTMFGTGYRNRRYNLFFALCSSNFMALFLDLFSWIIDGTAGMRILVILENTALFMVNLILTAFFAFFIIEFVVEKEESRKKYRRIIMLLLIPSLLSRLLNIRFGYMFTVDAAGVYHRGPYHFIAYFNTIIIECMVLFIVFFRKVKREQRIAVIAFTALPFVAALASIFSYGLSVTYAFVLVSIVMIYSAFFVELESDQNRLREMFGRFVSTEVAQEIADNPGGKLIPGKRYHATVFVSDIRAFTVLSETMAPEKLVEMLNHYFGAVTEIVSSCGGVVTEFLGDGIMCIFGAPAVCRDHAEKAVAAGLALQQKLPEINAWNREHGFPMIETGIGIHSGTILLGSLGSAERARYTAIGETVDKTFLIESCSIGGQVLISNNTLRAIKCDVTAEFMMDYAPNPDQPTIVRIHEVTHIGGEWNVGRKRVLRKPEPIVNPRMVMFCTISGKQTDARKHEAEVLALSPDGIVLQTDTVLAELDNIRIDIPERGSIFAKVKRANENEYLIYFTSRPEWLEEWIKETTGK